MSTRWGNDPEMLAAFADHEWIDRHRPASEAIEAWSRDRFIGHECPNECGNCFRCGRDWAVAWVLTLLNNRGILILAQRHAAETTSNMATEGAEQEERPGV